VPSFLSWNHALLDTGKISVDSRFGPSVQKMSMQSTPHSIDSLLLVRKTGLDMVVQPLLNRCEIFAAALRPFNQDRAAGGHVLSFRGVPT